MQRRLATPWLLAAALLSGSASVVAAQQEIAQAAEKQEETAEPAESKKREAPKTTTRIDEVVIEAKRPLSAASSDEIRARDYELRPHATMMETLNNIPGLVVAQHQGGGKAPQWLVRGFDADHGTDVAISVDGLPVNFVTHAHGQGYADLNFIIPETVERFTLRKGPYFTDVGDFGNAGAINFVTIDEAPENFGLAQGGSFDTQRYVVMASPRLSWAKNVTAAQAYFTNGPFHNPQHYARYNFFNKFTLNPTPDHKLSTSVGVYSGDWDGSGQIPLRVVQAGYLQLYPNDPSITEPFDRFDSIDPTEGGKSDRENLDVHYAYTPTAEDEVTLQAYGSRYKLKLYSDFTFFKDTGLRFIETDAGVVDVYGTDVPGATYVPGDAIEQNDQRLLYGMKARYTRYWSLADMPQQTQLGLENRNDSIHVALYRQVRRQRFFTVNKIHVEERSLSTFLQQQVFFGDWLRIEAGLRGDIFFFDGRNELPAQAPDPNFDAVVISGNETDSIVSPKVNVVLTPTQNTDIYLNFGEGFHSNDARNVLLSKANPDLVGGTASALAQSLGYELGARTRQFDRLDVAAAIWLLDLESELVFSGDGGNQETGAGGSFEPSGPTRRWGIDFEARYQITDWLFADYDLSYADPRFRITGEAIPLAPTLLMNGGFTAQFPNGFSAGLRMRYLDDRPANEDRTLTARGYFLMDLLAKYRWRNVEASIAFLNITDTDWREAQFSDTSCVVGETGTNSSGCFRQPGKQGTHEEPPADIHFTPGNPFGVRAGLTLFF